MTPQARSQALLRLQLRLATGGQEDAHDHEPEHQPAQAQGLRGQLRVDQHVQQDRETDHRDDGITLLSTLVNFGALTAFLLLHVSVVWHFVVRQKSRDWWRHLIVPVIGFAILFYVIINAQVAAQRLGFVWLGAGVLILIFLMVTGREPELRTEEGL